MNRVTAEIPLELHRLVAIRDLVRAVATDVGEADVAALELAVHEVAVNVLRHARATEPLLVSVERTAASLHAEIVDDGVAFALEDAPRLPAGELREHGYGLLLVDRLVDHVSLTRADGRNRWHLTKELSA